MPKRDPEPGDIEEEVADAQAQIEALQETAADAEARAATAADELAAVRTELAEAQGTRDSAQAELAALHTELVGARTQLRDAAVRYREARLAAAPEIPADLVPSADDLEEIDLQFEAAQRVVGQLREKLEDETRSARVPVGSPPRRAPDLSALSPAEKIKMGLQQLADR